MILPEGLTHTSSEPVADEFWTRRAPAAVAAPSELNVIAGATVMREEFSSLLQPEAVVVQHGFENVLRGHILQADGHRRQFRFAIRAEFCHARIKDNIQVGLACQGFDDVHQRGVLE